ncbi:Hypothetical protein CGLY_15465 [Corynebacterium glyciniphilum AJ 3170]|uniref:Uncharacterized protein n=1 Tax=Corynebacterium glyciniphilum AJ 3170 TaxID=1404245 RepID=X5DW20_9CORY|nr:hypothetical protein [Corynebacterium glyciniphilum]AHW65529.1 Hypothetical protein CGLY_15465 [Corynebacterium glyciniphilum AJ 3170]
MKTPHGTTLPDPLVRVDNLDRSFGSRRVLRGLTVDLPREGIVDRLLILGADGHLSHDIDGADLGDRVVRLTGSTSRMTEVLDKVRGMPGIRLTAMRDVAGSMSVDIDLNGGTLPHWDGVTRERLGTEDAVIALTGEPES